MRKLPFLAVVLATGCATSPTGRSQLILLPDDQMATLGAQAFDQMKVDEPVSSDPALNQYVQCISNAILSGSGLDSGGAWEIVVFDSDLVNAFALPGAKIGVYTGMIRFAQEPRPARRRDRPRDRACHRSALQRAGQRAAGGGHRPGGTGDGARRLSDQPEHAQRSSSPGWGSATSSGARCPTAARRSPRPTSSASSCWPTAGFDPERGPGAVGRSWPRGARAPPSSCRRTPSPDRRAADLRERLPDVQSKYDGGPSRGPQAGLHRGRHSPAGAERRRIAGNSARAKARSPWTDTPCWNAWSWSVGASCSHPMTCHRGP
jgi:hypothetical protein